MERKPFSAACAELHDFSGSWELRNSGVCLVECDDDRHKDSNKNRRFHEMHLSAVKWVPWSPKKSSDI